MPSSFRKLGCTLVVGGVRCQGHRDRRALWAAGCGLGSTLPCGRTNVPEWILLQFAAARIGVILVTINPAYRPFELEYVLKQSDTRALFLIDCYKKSDYFGMISEVCPALTNCETGTMDERQVFHCCTRLSRSAGNALEVRWGGKRSWRAGETVTVKVIEEAAAKLRPTDAINIQYTSGTTGFPKAATLSHRNLLWNVYLSGECLRYTEADRICIPVPLYHCFGCVLGTMCAIVHGSAMVIPAESFDPPRRSPRSSLNTAPRCTVCRRCSSRSCTIRRWPRAISRRCARGSWPAVLAPSNDAGCCHADELPRDHNRLRPDRSVTVITQTRFDDPLELRGRNRRPRVARNRGQNHRPATGETLPDNSPGELCARGHCVMIGYYNQPDATAAAIDPEGWLHTGDIAVRLPNGYFKITGRIKDMVIRGGENIYPRESRSFSSRTRDRACGGRGVPDAKYGEELCAWIKLKRI